MSDPNPELERGRERYARRAWVEAHQALSRADEQASLSASDLELLATAAYLLGRDEEYLKTLERAHQAHLDAGDELRAVRAAFWIGFRLFFRGENGQANGWFGRAQRLFDRSAQHAVEEGYLKVRDAEDCLGSGDCDRAFSAGENAADVGEQFGDLDLIAMARHQQGRARLEQQRLPEGLSLLDETMVLVSAGRLSPIVTGLMYCSVIDNCQRVYAFGRACEWTTVLSAWCDEQPEMVAFSGICRVHRAEVLHLRGEWEDALDEARRAFERARTVNPQAAAAAAYQLGEIHRLRGELELAEDAYRRASQQGFEPLPGLALLRLAEGHVDKALAAIQRALKTASSPFRRARLLPACVEILLAAGDHEHARSTCDELAQLARTLDASALRAIAAQARGELELAEGRAETALEALRTAVEAWQEVDAPYLVAKVRALVGLAYRALGDEDGAELELDAARAVFERLGARPDVDRLDALTRTPRDARPHGLTAREQEVLRSIAAGLTNKAIASRLCVSERTIDRHVSNIYSKLGVSSRAAATAKAYEHQLI